MKHRSRYHTNRRLTSADERALDRRIAERRRNQEEDDRRADQRLAQWLEAQRNAMTPEQRHAASAHHAALQAKALQDRRDRELADFRRRTDPFSTLGT